jgi:hypothetical protein
MRGCCLGCGAALLKCEYIATAAVRSAIALSLGLRKRRRRVLNIGGQGGTRWVIGGAASYPDAIANRQGVE